ncbi:hypothetical protein GF312_18155 [Candidatus Poribacteria bacterium]|nr:hypothetical protein [Candidatus Poribacteria bacterium]
MKVYTSGFDLIENNKVIMPLAFDRAGSGWRIATFLQLKEFTLQNTTTYFPTYFKSDFRRPNNATIEGNLGGVDLDGYAKGIDYIIAWGLVAGSDWDNHRGVV